MTENSPTDTKQPDLPTYESTARRDIGKGRTFVINVRQVGGPDRGFCDRSIAQLQNHTNILWNLSIDPETFDRLHIKKEYPVQDGGYYIEFRTVVDDERAAEAQALQAPLSAAVELTIQGGMMLHHKHVMVPELEHRLQDFTAELQAQIPHRPDLDDDTIQDIMDRIILTAERGRSEG